MIIHQKQFGENLATLTKVVELVLICSKHQQVVPEFIQKIVRKSTKRSHHGRTFKLRSRGLILAIKKYCQSQKKWHRMIGTLNLTQISD